MRRTLGPSFAALFLLLGSTAQPSGAQNLSGAPTIQSATGASGFMGAGLAQGTWVEIHGTNLATTTRPWSSVDFVNAIAPVSLDGVTVKVGGEPAFVAYISPTQVNVLLPSDLPVGQQSVVVANGVLASAPFPVVIRQTAPALWTPSSFNIGGTQYAGAVF